MSKKITTELRKLSSEELKTRVAELRTQLVEQTRARAAGELSNSNAIKNTRREIAVALTLLAAPSDETEKEEAK